jgi:hypothetical protein
LVEERLGIGFLGDIGGDVMEALCFGILSCGLE